MLASLQLALVAFIQEVVRNSHSASMVEDVTLEVRELNL